MDQGAEARALRDALAGQLEESGVANPAVAHAVRSVPRHEFVPHAPIGDAYSDIPIQIMDGDSLVTVASQPTAMALLLSGLGSARRVLEVGTGTGYQAGLIASIVGEDGAVTTLERDAVLAGCAARTLSRVGIENVEVRHHDASAALEGLEPFDAVVLGCTAAGLPRHWLDLLAPRGRVLGPFELGLPGLQPLVSWARDADSLVGTVIGTSRYMPMIGGTLGPPRAQVVAPGVRVRSHEAAEVWRMLGDGTPTSVFALPEVLRADFPSLLYWITASAPASLVVQPDTGTTLSAIGGPELGSWAGVRGARGLAMLRSRRPWNPAAVTSAFEVVCYGDPELGRQVVRQVARWVEAGGPPLDQLEHTARPGARQPTGAHEVVRPWGTLAIKPMRVQGA